MYMNFSVNKYLLLLVALFFSALSPVLSQHNTRVVITGINDNALKSKMENNVSEFLTSLNLAFQKNNKPKFASGIITSSSYASLLSMWEMSPFRCYETDIVEKASRRATGGYEVRNIPIFVKDAPKDDQYQEVVIIFDDKGVIDNLYISIETNRYNQILTSGQDVTEFRRRQVILDFVENFRTAYNRKDLSFIESVFSDDALIIVGKTVKVQKTDASGNMISQEVLSYQKRTKGEYISSLRSVFNNNSYVKVDFDDIEVKRHGKFPQIYGVSMNQGWSTSRYSDNGYLLLVIDFTDEDKPMIHVRTWQPDKVGGKSLSDDEKFKLEQFNIAR
jgi:hypothetical protein